MVDTTVCQSLGITQYVTLKSLVKEYKEDRHSERVTQKTEKTREESV